MKVYGLSVLILLFMFQLQAQKHEAYFTQDTVSNVGFNIKLFSDAANSKYCHIQYDNFLKKYAPEEVDEYGVNGHVFVSTRINYKGDIRKVFLERLSKGKITLYSYVAEDGRLFYYTNPNDTLVPLPRNKNGKNYKETIKKLTEMCPHISKKVINRLAYKKQPLATTIKYYNDCKSRYIPFIKIGAVFSAGVHKNTLTEAMKLETFTTNKLADLTYPVKTNLEYGIFVDLPIHLSRHSIHLELLINNYNHTFSKSVLANYQFVEYMKADLVLELNTTAAHLPVMYRYTYPGLNKRLYANGGFKLGLLINDDSSLRYDFANGETQFLTQQITSDYLFGLISGIGTEFKLTEKIIGFTGLRYTLEGINSSKTFTQHFLSLNLGCFFDKNW